MKLKVCVLCGNGRSRASVNTTVVASSKKTDLKQQGLNSVKNSTVKKNLMGVSDSMEKKGWVDPQGRKGKVRHCCKCAHCTCSN